MKVRNLILMMAIFAGSILYVMHLQPETTMLPMSACDAMEESRLRMALNECSDAVMLCTWGDENDYGR